MTVHIVDRGSGAPVVVIPGIQGRWEWMRPGIDALARRCRVITFSLADEPSCYVGQAFSPAKDSSPFDADTGFDCYVDQVRDAMDRAGVERAAIVGVSYGGLIAAAFAARHPERVHSLVLASALPPSWTPDARVRFYLRAPRLLSPLFMLASVRMLAEITAAHPGVRATAREALRHASNVLRHMFSPVRMARRVRLLASADFVRVRGLQVPTLVVTGEPGLDRVVPVRATREYLTLFPHARMATVERTGHLGFITRPEVFTEIVASFVAETGGHTESRRHIG